ncbi:MAG: type II toxin-antitoxin system RelE/ParE family toxin [Gammaproteobacteria bacterium]|nr:type II toxin-antitoxin system RelE/ParE family toxin [Gammaproteobacteria bacterium]
MKIDYTEDAIEDLVQLREFIAQKDPAAAERYARLLIDGITRLESQPHLGHSVYYAPEPENIRDLIVGNYIVRYALLDEHILILRIWHHRENWK